MVAWRWLRLGMGVAMKTFYLRTSPSPLYCIQPGPTESVGADLGLHGAYWIIVVIICHCSKSRR